ncbi:MAG: ABC transporter ATP-binding protein [Anaerolineae bacterium]
MSAQPGVIETRQLTKRYGRFTALDNLDLRIEAGALFGFIGPNGAGKTTTLRMLAGLLEPSSGQISLNGQEISQDVGAARWLVGYMPDFFGVYEDMKVWEYLDFFARCYRLDAHHRARVVNELLELVDLASRRDAWVESLSRGMRQRLCLAHALVHDPQILLLDEPASGLDPRARIEMRELLKELSALGKTIIISSHILTELAEMCNQVGIIEHGRLLYHGSPQRISQQMHGHRRLRLRALAAQPEVEAGLNSYLGVTDYQLDDDGWQINFTGDDAALAGLLTYLIERKIPIIHFSEEISNLEAAFMQITTGEVK